MVPLTTLGSAPDLVDITFVERRIGTELGSASVVADSKQLLLCSYLSAVLLVGLVINSTLG